MMNRNDKLMTMKGSDLISLADKLGVKVSCNKARTALKESKQAVIDRIIAKENEKKEPEIEHIEVTDLKAVVRVTQKDIEEEKKEEKTKKKEQKKEKKVKEKKEKINTFDIVGSILNNIDDVTYSITPQGKGMSIKKDGKKVLEAWKRSNRIRLCLGAETLQKVDTGLLEDITDNPAMKRYNKSVYVPAVNIGVVLTSILA